MAPIRIAVFSLAAMATPLLHAAAQGRAAEAPWHQRARPPVNTQGPVAAAHRFARCGDGSLWTGGAETRGACTSHGGVKEWLNANPDHDWPEASLARCKDGAIYSGTDRHGACAGHRGVKQWRADDDHDNARPREATAHCGDGTWWTAAARQGACASHGGVKHWLGNGHRAPAATRPRD